MICLCAILSSLLLAWLVLVVLSRPSLLVSKLRGVSHVFLNITEPCMAIQSCFPCKRIISHLAGFFGVSLATKDTSWVVSSKNKCM